MAAMGLWFGTEEASEVEVVEKEVRMQSPSKVDNTGNEKKIREAEARVNTQKLCAFLIIKLL